MAYLILGGLGLAALIAIAQVLVQVNASTLVRLARYAIGFALIGFGAAFTYGGRAGIGLPMIVLGGSTLIRQRLFNFDLGAGRRSPGKGSTVRSAYLAMELDHDTGTMTGRVTAGRQAGRNLDELDKAVLRELYREVAADRDSLALFEAYLDRRLPSWREDFQHDSAAGSAGASNTGAMTEKEAYEILGLLPGAGDAEIRAAHRRLMKRVHPDQGGSTFLATRINEAKDFLLGRHR